MKSTSMFVSVIAITLSLAAGGARAGGPQVDGSTMKATGTASGVKIVTTPGSSKSVSGNLGVDGLGVSGGYSKSTTSPEAAVGVGEIRILDGRVSNSQLEATGQLSDAYIQDARLGVGTIHLGRE